VAGAPADRVQTQRPTDGTRLRVAQRRGGGCNSRGHTYEVERIAFALDGARVVSADSLQIKEWALESGDEEGSAAVGARAAGQVKVTADGACAVAVLEDGRLGVWNMRTGALESALPPASGPAFGDPGIGPSERLVLAPRAPRILSWNGELLCVWDLQVGASVGYLSVADVRDAAITPDGRGVVAVNGMDITLWRPDEGECTVLGTYDGDPPGYVAISPDGRRALSSGGDRNVVVWRLNGPPPPPRDRLLNSYWPDARDKPSTVAFAGLEEAIVTTGDGSLFVLDMRAARSS
jgi:WD40 repeat protein